LPKGVRYAREDEQRNRGDDFEGFDMTIDEKGAD
jgi:hypothetical protein